MKIVSKICVATVLMATSVCSFAAQWTCTTYDSRQHGYTAVDSSAKTAMQKSFKTCLRLSNVKRTCNMSASNCHRVAK